MEWETVIGLEIHCQLATQSKIFSGASTAFGAEPNTQACAVDLALPGTLPVFNERALEMAVRFGLAINAEIGRKSVFDRKNYFYPDLPKGYQTSQLAFPIVQRGYVDIQLDDGTSKRIGITRAHLEEDAGKSLHEDFHGMTGIDLNRAGTPLLEIVSEPDIRSAREAVAYARKIHAIVTALGISDGDMSQGSFRCDVNISVRPKGSDKFGTRTETKNLNSFRFMEEAIKLEVARQIEILEDGGEIVQETRLYNGETGEARAMRSKEEANDYRYFPCPDLLPVVIDEEYIERIRASLPELPDERIARFKAEYGLGDYEAGILAADGAMAAYFEKAARTCGDSKLTANWMLGEVARQLNSSDLEIGACPVSAEALGGLLVRIKDSTINNNAAKKVFAAMWAGEGSADEIIEAKGLRQVTDTGAIEAAIDQVIASCNAQVEQYKAAAPDKRGKMLGFFMGQVMRATGGKANPGQVNQILKAKLDALCD